MIDDKVLRHLLIKSRNLACWSLDVPRPPGMERSLRLYIDEVDELLGFTRDRFEDHQENLVRWLRGTLGPSMVDH